MIECTQGHVIYAKLGEHLGGCPKCMEPVRVVRLVELEYDDWRDFEGGLQQ